MPPDLYRHRTARERAAVVSAAVAVERAQGHVRQPEPEPVVDGNPGGPVTPAVARLIREHIERKRGQR